jgi:hypothetical protein
MKINLTGSDVQTRSVIGSAQRCLNLYIEAVDQKQGEPGPVTHYPTPGLTLLGVTPNGLPIRGLYSASNGDLYAAAGFVVYYIDKTWQFYVVGTMTTTFQMNPVKFADNGLEVVLCDGTVNGYSIDMTTRTGLSPLYAPLTGDSETPSSNGWLGSTYLDFTDTYIVANSPGTPIFYISNSEDVIFDPSQFASKSAYADLLVAAIVQHRVVWLIGTLSTEVWYDVGVDASVVADTFPFEEMPGIAIDWGCAAPYSIAKAETSIFFLARNLNGQAVVLRGSGYSISRISNHGLEYQLSTYETLADCRAYSFMLLGHSTVVFNFPTADKTWAYDLATQSWHELCWIDESGIEHRHRAEWHAFAYETNVVSDWENANLYKLDLENFTDNGQPIKRQVGFPRQVDPDDDHRILYQNFIAEMDCGESLIPGDNPLLTLDWSDDKGRSWSNGLEQPLGAMGEFSTLMKWNRIGLSRNRVYRLTWSANAFTALQAAYLTVQKAAS